MMNHLTFAILALLLLAPVNVLASTPSRRVYSVEMEPFQILYITNNSNNGTSDGTMDEFHLLDATKEHLMECLQEADSDLLGLSIYHVPRTDEDELFQNGTQVAFGGEIHYSLPHTTEQLISTEYLSFLGKNATKYVDLLQALGWTDLASAVLLTARGRVVELDENGGMIERDLNDDAIDDAYASSHEMDSDMSMMLYLVAVLVPCAVVAMTCVCWLSYRARNNLSCLSPAAAAPVDVVWSSQHESKEQRENQVAIHRHVENLQDDTSCDSDEHSVKVAIPSLPTVRLEDVSEDV